MSMSVFDPTDPTVDSGHEQVVFCQDERSGLRAIIAIYSTALGPALGGTRLYPYPSEAAALTDVLKLSKAMAYKAACAGLDLGGGKAVIIGDTTIKTEALLRAYGRMVEALNGRYYTACDVGTTVADIDVIKRETRFATGGSTEYGGAGDSAILTAYGVFQAMRAAASHRWDDTDLSGKTVAVEGVGKVGGYLIGHLLEAGAQVVATDVRKEALADLPSDVIRVATDELLAGHVDVYAPCALGGTVTEQVVTGNPGLVICGAANNQLARSEVADLMLRHGVLYVPDFVANAGGVIQVADEVLAGDGFQMPRAEARAHAIFETTTRVLQISAESEASPVTAATLLAEERMREVGRLKTFHL
ncbi:MAG: Glu/Leu/Phe/Val dehydrogenase dimerization region [Frankiales bacterium]|nr:Glu/Leu/Phe/Val dehydrogenase dimerization region [Frankiales bacterium]